MGMRYVCKQCGREFSHTPYGVVFTFTGLGTDTDDRGFCSKGCMNAYEREKKQAKEAAQRERAAKKLAKEEEKRRNLEKKHEEKRKEAQDALKKAQNNVTKWEGAVEKLEAALESDDMKELDEAITSATSGGEMLVGCLFWVLILALVGGAIWFYFFDGKAHLLKWLS